MTSGRERLQQPELSEQLRAERRDLGDGAFDAAWRHHVGVNGYAEMAELGVVLRSRVPEGVAEEAAFAYKDIESLMAASASVVRPTKWLTPLGQGPRLGLIQHGRIGSPVLAAFRSGPEALESGTLREGPERIAVSPGRTGLQQLDRSIDRDNHDGPDIYER